MVSSSSSSSERLIVLLGITLNTKLAVDRYNPDDVNNAIRTLSTLALNPTPTKALFLLPDHGDQALVEAT